MQGLRAVRVPTHMNSCQVMAYIKDRREIHRFAESRSTIGDRRRDYGSLAEAEGEYQPIPKHNSRCPKQH